MKKKNNSNGISIKQLLEFSKNINEKAKTNSKYKEVVKIANEKWINCCGYDFR